MTLLPPEALRFRYGNALQADLLQRFLNFIELKRLNNRFDFFHSGTGPPEWASRVAPRNCLPPSLPDSRRQLRGISHTSVLNLPCPFSLRDCRASLQQTRRQ